MYIMSSKKKKSSSGSEKKLIETEEEEINPRQPVFLKKDSISDFEINDWGDYNVILKKMYLAKNIIDRKNNSFNSLNKPYVMTQEEEKEFGEKGDTNDKIQKRYYKFLRTIIDDGNKSINEFLKNFYSDKKTIDPTKLTINYLKTEYPNDFRLDPNYHVTSSEKSNKAVKDSLKMKLLKKINDQNMDINVVIDDNTRPKLLADNEPLENKFNEYIKTINFKYPKEEEKYKYSFGKIESLYKNTDYDDNKLSTIINKVTDISDLPHKQMLATHEEKKFIKKSLFNDFNLKSMEDFDTVVANTFKISTNEVLRLMENIFRSSVIDTMYDRLKLVFNKIKITDFIHAVRDFVAFMICILHSIPQLLNDINMINYQNYILESFLDNCYIPDDKTFSPIFKIKCADIKLTSENEQKSKIFIDKVIETGNITGAGITVNSSPFYKIEDKIYYMLYKNSLSK